MLVCNKGWGFFQMKNLTNIYLCVSKREQGSLMKQHIWNGYIGQVDKRAALEKNCTVTLRGEREREREHGIGVAGMGEKMKGRPLGRREGGGDRGGRRERQSEERKKKENHLN